MKDRSSRKKESRDAPELAHPRREPGPRTRIGLACLCLIVAGWALCAHWPVLSAQARSFDDEEVLIQNQLVQNPSWHSVRRFFGEITLSTVVRGYYRPLTLTSLMLDCAMGGRPDDLRAFHRTSLALHLGSTVLLILLCYQIFRQPVVAALAGLLFGLHPLTVEPIAWVMERKTVLAAFFAFACLNGYVRYTRTGGWGWFVAALLLYLMSLLSKPTGTPLPVMMLLMDYWPLKRFSRRAVIEKIPFIALAAGFAVLCVVCEHKVNTLVLPTEQSPLHLPLRLCWLIAFYPSKVLLPINLTSVYVLPEPFDLTNSLVVLAVAATAVMTVGLTISGRWTPAFWVAAAMFYIGLSPTMGFIGYSWVHASDKYTYLPAVGLLLGCAWLMERAWSADANDGRGLRRTGLVVGVLVAACLLTAATRHQTQLWRTSESLLTHELALAPGTAHLYNSRGSILSEAGEYNRAIEDYGKAIGLSPEYAEAYHNRCMAYINIDELDLAIRDCNRAIELKPDLAEAYNNRGNAYRTKGQYEQAVRDSTQAIELKPEYPAAYNNRGNAYEGMGRLDKALDDYTRAIELDPRFSKAYNNRAIVFNQTGVYDRAIQDSTRAIELKPDYAKAYNTRGIALGYMGRHAQAIQDFTKAIELDPDYRQAYHSRAVSHFQLKEYAKAWADLDRFRRLGGRPHPDFIKALDEASSRSEQAQE